MKDLPQGIPQGLPQGLQGPPQGLQGLPQGKLRVRLEETNEILVVDEDDIEKANPPQFDRVEDLAQLRYLNESSVLHTLRQRYAENLIHTYAGGNMLVVNPMAPLAIYSDKVYSPFQEFLIFF